jgi:hypothetical protein
MWKKKGVEIGRRFDSIGVLNMPIGVRRKAKESPCPTWFA